MIRKNPIQKKMTRKKARIQEVEMTPARQILIKHIIKFHPYWKNNIKYMSNIFLLNNTQSNKREELTELIEQEIKNKRK